MIDFAGWLAHFFMAALRVRDIDLGRGRIRIERSASKVNAKTIIGTTKTHAARSVAVSSSVLKLLAPAMVGKAPDELLWCRGDGQPLRPPTTTHWFGAAVKRCQAAADKARAAEREAHPDRDPVTPAFPRVTVHELLHTAASLMIASGANVKTVQSQLGHKTATMTLDQYGHLFPDDLDDVADRMDDLVAAPAEKCAHKRNRPGWKSTLTCSFTASSVVELTIIFTVSSAFDVFHPD